MRTKTIQLVALALTFFSSPVFPATPHLRRSYKDTHSRTTAAVSPAAASFELHQHHVVREYHDTCAYIDADVLDNVSILGISLGLDVDICICISLLPLIISANVELEALVPLVGLNDLIAKLGVVVNDSPNGQHCTYPDHAYAICSQGNPCGFGCEPPYVVDDGQCVCPPPLSSCNGVCGSFPHGCGSSGPKSWSRRSGGPVQRRIDSGSGITTFADAQATCKMNETVCGVYGSSVTGFECLDTDTQLESCGGCTVPNPFFPAAAQNANAAGRDCSAITGVSGVTCVAGQCAVHSCAEGWVVSTDGAGCDPRGIDVQTGARVWRARDNKISE